MAENSKITRTRRRGTPVGSERWKYLHPRWDELTEEEKADRNERARIWRVEISAEMTGGEIFRRTSWPGYRIPFPRIFSMNVPEEKRREVLKDTWDEFADMLQRGAFDEVRFMQQELRNHERRFNREAEKMLREKVEGIGAPIGKKYSDEERAELREWYEHELLLADVRPPDIWFGYSEDWRQWLIRGRQRVQQLEDAAGAARFRLAVLTSVLGRYALHGTVSKWGEVPEAERKELIQRRGEPVDDLQELTQIYLDTSARLHYLHSLWLNGARSWAGVLAINHAECKRLKIPEGGTGWYASERSLEKTANRHVNRKNGN